MKQTYIADEIGSEYMNWDRGDVIYITAHTGSGKTSFILDVLWPYAKQYWFTILYVVNRCSLRLQLKTELAKRFLIAYETMEELDSMTAFGGITIVNYQYMEKLIDVKQNVSLYNMGVNHDFNYVVFDEAHYFVEDSMFNSYTEEVYKTQKYHFKRATRIFISATLDDFIEYNCQNENLQLYDYDYNLTTKPTRIWQYDLKQDYSQYIITYFNDFESICKRINDDKTDYKWLIFVSNKSTAELIRKNISVEACIVSAESKGNCDSADGQAFKQIVRDQRFESKVIIATSVIDCGVNLHDELLRNIVISTISRTQFLQMLGRKRRDSNLPINLFIDAKSLSQINAYKTLFVNKLIEIIYLYRENKEKALKTIFENTEIYHLCHHLFYFNGKRFEINEIAVWKIFKTNKSCNRIIDLFKKEGRKAFVKEQLSWLGLEDTYNEINWIDFEDKQNIVSEIKHYLAEKEGFMLDKSMQKELRNKMTILFDKLYGRLEVERTSINLGILKINHIFDKYNYNFTINSIISDRKTYWMIKKINRRDSFEKRNNLLCNSSK